MADLAKPVAPPKARLHFSENAVIQTHDDPAYTAQQMMMVMPGGIGISDFESGHTVPEINPAHQPHVFKERQRPVNRAQVAPALRCGVHDLLRSGRPPQLLKRRDNDTPRAGYASCAATQSLHPFRRRGVLVATI